MNKLLKKSNTKKGFSAPELVLCSLVAGMIIFFAMPHIKEYKAKAETVSCFSNMQILNKEIAMHIELHGAIHSISELENKDIECPRGGKYEIIFPENKNRYPHVECSLHGKSNKKKKTQVSEGFTAQPDNN